MLVLCTQCQTQYEFDVALVPPGGYDAQCTQCGAVFFVANPSAAAETPSADMLAMGDVLGEPDKDLAAPSVQEEFVRLGQKRRRKIIVGASICGAVLVASLGTYFFAPRIFDATLGRVLRIRRTIDPQAVAHVRLAYPFILQDTMGGYEAGRAELQKALAIDKRYPEALALLAISYVFTGQDFETQSQILHSQPLRTSSVQALGEAGKVLQEAVERYAKNPRILEALAIYHLADPSGAVKGETFLQESLAARGEKAAEVDPAKMPSFWSAFAQGLVWQKKQNDGRAVQYWDSALAREPNAMRVRFLRASALARLERKDEAVRDLNIIIAAWPGRSDAHALLNSLTAAPAAVPSVSPPAAPVAKKTKHKVKHKKMRARGR